MGVNVRHISGKYAVIMVMHTFANNRIKSAKVHTSVTPRVARFSNLVVGAQTYRGVSGNESAAAPTWLIQCMDNFINGKCIAGREPKSTRAPATIVRVSDGMGVV